jgi:hypothetical protein
MIPQLFRNVHAKLSHHLNGARMHLSPLISRAVGFISIAGTGIEEAFGHLRLRCTVYTEK